MEAKHSALQWVSEGNHNLIDSIGELLEAKTGLMLTKIKLDMVSYAKDLNMDCASLKKGRRSEQK